jgi:hypothetical protein
MFESVQENNENAIEALNLKLDDMTKAVLSCSQRFNLKELAEKPSENRSNSVDYRTAYDNMAFTPAKSIPSYEFV